MYKQNRYRAPIRTASPGLRKLLEAIEASPLSANEIMRRCNVAPSTINSLKAGRRTPTIITAEILAEAMGLTLEWVPK